MKLNDISSELFDIASGIECNTISYFHPLLVSAKNGATPDERILAIAAPLKWAATNGIPVSKAEASKAVEALKEIARKFKIDELTKPIKDLESYRDNLV